MKNVYLYSYQYSTGAKELAKALNIHIIKRNNSKFLGNKYKTVINWGAQELNKNILKAVVLNHPEAIQKASGKLSFFRTLNGTGLTPEYTEDIKTAIKWDSNDETVVCRTLLNASGGRGIVIDRVVQAPLYVKYVPKKSEFRVHFLNNEIIDVQKKAKVHNFENPNWQIRNLEGGFIYARHNIEVPNAVLECANDVISKFDLDFGAIDIIYNEKHNKAYALEINTAPGLEGQTIAIYASAFNDYLLSIAERN